MATGDSGGRIGKGMQQYNALESSSSNVENLQHDCTLPSDSFLTSVAPDNNHDSSSSSDMANFVLYPQRHLVLLAFSILTCVNGWQWITWSPLTPTPLVDLWKVPSAAIDGLSSLYMIVYLMFSPLALYLIHSKGLRFGFLVGGVLNLTGAALMSYDVVAYDVVWVGTLFCSLAQTFTLSLPPLIAGRWYGEHERAVATGVGVLANQFGVALGMGSTVFVDFRYDAAGTTKLVYYMGLQTAVSLTAFLLILRWVTEDRPKTPPSAAEAVLCEPGNGNTTHNNNHDDSLQHAFLPSFFALFRSPSRIVFTLLYGVNVGVFYGVATFLNQIFAPFYSQHHTGWLGIFYVLAGIVGSLWSGRVLDKAVAAIEITAVDTPVSLRRAYHGVTVSMFVASTVSLASLWGLVSYLDTADLHTTTTTTTTRDHTMTVTAGFVVVSAAGFALTAVMSVGFEYGTALCYPADEAAVGGILMSSGQLVGWALNVLGGSYFRHSSTDGDDDETVVASSSSSSSQFLSVMAAIMGLASVVLWTAVTELPHRPVHDQGRGGGDGGVVAELS